MSAPVSSLLPSVLVLTSKPGDVQLWHIDGQERLHRQIKELDKGLGKTCRVGWLGSAVDAPGIASAATSLDSSAALILNADYLFDKQTLNGLLKQRDAVLRDAGTGDIAAVACAPERAFAYHQLLLDNPSATLTNLRELTLAELAEYDDHLRRNTPPSLHHVPSASATELEAHLYGNSYKGITDLVTKWWWPVPAKKGVALCSKLGLSANAVTLFGLVLMLVACWCFYVGLYVPGLLCGWFMTFLDTVDGKLARVTVTSSRVGHVLDHGMDILHPPFWYWCWLLSSSLESVNQLVMLTFVGYIAGRLIEAAFHALGSCGLFSWRPLDAYFRLVTARRNPCLILLTVFTLVGLPDWGILAVVGWTLLSSLLLLLRLFYAIGVRLSKGQLQSWLAQPQAEHLYPRAHKTFAATNRAYS